MSSLLPVGVVSHARRMCHPASLHLAAPGDWTAHLHVVALAVQLLEPRDRSESRERGEPVVLQVQMRQSREPLWGGCASNTRVCEHEALLACGLDSPSRGMRVWLPYTGDMHQRASSRDTQAPGRWSDFPAWCHFPWSDSACDTPSSDGVPKVDRPSNLACQTPFRGASHIN